jgi:S1-C subfamily serine protease
MRRVALYSSSSRQQASGGGVSQPAPAYDGESLVASESTPAQPQAPKAGRGGFFRRHKSLFLFSSGALLAVLLVFAHARWAPAPQALTQGDIDRAVRSSLEKKPLPSNAARAYQKIIPSVVRVRGYGQGKNPKTGEVAEFERGVGSGVVIVDKGLILTNLHVVSGNERTSVTFFDGSESDAIVVGVRPEHDLAVLQAKTIPDDLEAATLRSTADLRPGDDVLAVGFPFGFGPSASAGVVSGLKREFNSPKGERPLTNLIQFDAAANPGNSGGPLVNTNGEVVGIVTAILNPKNEGFFVGLAFAVPIEDAAGAVGVSPF